MSACYHNYILAKHFNILVVFRGTLITHTHTHTNMHTNTCAPLPLCRHIQQTRSRQRHWLIQERCDPCGSISVGRSPRLFSLLSVDSDDPADSTRTGTSSYHCQSHKNKTVIRHGYILRTNEKKKTVFNGITGGNDAQKFHICS